MDNEFWHNAKVYLDTLPHDSPDIFNKEPRPFPTNEQREQRKTKFQKFKENMYNNYSA